VCNVRSADGQPSTNVRDRSRAKDGTLSGSPVRL
jgi:hypothetical protein